jgi:EH_Signature domain
MRLLCSRCRETRQVGAYAALRAATRCVSNGNTSACELLTQRGLALNTPYASTVAEALLNLTLRKLERTQELQEARHLCEELIPADRDLLLPQVFANAVKGLVRLASSGSAGSALRDTVKDFVLREERLGDPRRNPTQWTNAGLATEAETVTSWLSEEDLRFFFDSIMKGQPDPHGRYQFWLRYVDRVRNFRVAIGEKYRQSHRVELDGLKKRGRSYAELDGWDASAFIMDFGSVIVVEFSQTGNACSVHEAKAGREKIGDLRANKFYKSKLKRPLRSLGWFRHDHDGNWKREVRQYLSGFGVWESYGR